MTTAEVRREIVVCLNEARHKLVEADRLGDEIPLSQMEVGCITATLDSVKKALMALTIVGDFRESD